MLFINKTLRRKIIKLGGITGNNSLRKKIYFEAKNNTIWLIF
jgi:hypothetical protein